MKHRYCFKQISIATLIKRGIVTSLQEIRKSDAGSSVFREFQEFREFRGCAGTTDAIVIFRWEISKVRPDDRAGCSSSREIRKSGAGSSVFREFLEFRGMRGNDRCDGDFSMGNFESSIARAVRNINYIPFIRTTSIECAVMENDKCPCNQDAGGEQELVDILH